jgi:hypothetical protein
MLDMGLISVPPNFRGDKIEDMHLEQPKVFIERD